MEKEEKIKLVVETYLSEPNMTIERVSSKTEIPSSSVQRYLKDPSLSKLLTAEELAELKSRITKNRAEGRRKGGINSFLNNVPIKDKDGKFIGNKKYNGNEDRLKQKYRTILELYKLIFSRSCNSLEELTNCYNEKLPEDKKLTKDYVYDCLTTPYLGDVFEGQMYYDIQNWLNNNRELGNKLGATIVNSRKK